jgi:two-component system, chemotaxis family, chemotaxis protein CheY
MTASNLLNLRILLVEDETFIRRTIRRLLRSIGTPEIREAADGTEALSILTDGFDPDIIFCDVQMAPMDGFTFLREVRSLPDSGLAATPVIVLTASADVNVVRRFSQLGIRSYLLKPVSRKQLDEHMTAAIRRTETSYPGLPAGARPVPWQRPILPDGD